MGTFRLGICMWGFPLEGASGVRLAAEMGFQGAEISLGPFETGFPLSDSKIQDAYLRASREYEIELTSLSVEHLNQYGLNHPLESKKGMIAMEGCERGLKAAERMGIPVLQLPSFNDGAIRGEADFKNTCEKIKILCEMAQKSNVVIAAENALSVSQSKRMIKEVNAPNFKIMFDSQNYFLERQAVTADVLRELYPYVEQIHLKDGRNGKLSSCLLGQGESGFFETAEVIKETQCSQWLLLENYYNLPPLNQLDEDPFKLVVKDIEIMKRTFDIAE